MDVYLLFWYWYFSDCWCGWFEMILDFVRIWECFSFVTGCCCMIRGVLVGFSEVDCYHRFSNIVMLMMTLIILWYNHHTLISTSSFLSLKTEAVNLDESNWIKKITVKSHHHNFEIHLSLTTNSRTNTIIHNKDHTLSQSSSLYDNWWWLSSYDRV